MTAAIAALPTPADTATLDEILTLQLLVAWAGEQGDEPPRLGWWRSAMVDEFGGEDLFRRLLPQTWRWAVLEAARAAARRVDARFRGKAANPDELLSLYHLGFALDELLDDRLAELKHSGAAPQDALPGLDRLERPWDPDAFLAYLGDLAPAEHGATPAGRRLKGAPPADLLTAARALAAAHAQPGDGYPAPHYRTGR